MKADPAPRDKKPVYRLGARGDTQDDLLPAPFRVGAKRCPSTSKSLREAKLDKPMNCEDETNARPFTKRELGIERFLDSDEDYDREVDYPIRHADLEEREAGSVCPADNFPRCPKVGAHKKMKMELAGEAETSIAEEADPHGKELLMMATTI